MKHSWLAAGLLAAISGVAVADTAPGAAPAAAPAADSAEEKVCFEAPRTGSNIKKRTCMTKAEADRRRAEDKEAMQGLKRGSAGRSNSNVDPAIR